MSSKKTPSHSINISGGQLSNVQIGGHAGRDLSMNQSQCVTNDSANKLLTSSDVAALLDEFQALLEQSQLSEIEKVKVVRSIDVTKDEVQADEPDKKFAAQNLERAVKVLKNADETLEVGTGIWQKAKPILEAIQPWFGIAMGFLV